MIKATIITIVGTAEQQLGDEWRKRWGKCLKLKNTGCQCCVDIWEGKGPREAFTEIPPSLFAYGQGPNDKPNS